MRPIPCLLLAILAPAAALAQPAAYRATPAAAPPASLVAKDMIWRCAGGACAAPRTGQSPDTVVCHALARKLGALTGFEAAGAPFDADALARCNAR